MKRYLCIQISKLNEKIIENERICYLFYHCLHRLRGGQQPHFCKGIAGNSGGFILETLVHCWFLGHRFHFFIGPYHGEGLSLRLHGCHNLDRLVLAGLPALFQPHRDLYRPV